MPKINLSCLCTQTQHTFSIPASHLPLSTHLCSCDISRRISGSLLTSYINITLPPPPSSAATTTEPARKPDTSTCTAYHSSEILKRWFCRACGTHMYLEYNADGHFEAATGAVRGVVWGGGEEVGEGNTKELEGEEVIKYESCMWLSDVKDGGASVWMQHVGGKELERWSEDAGTSTRLPSLSATQSNEDKTGRETAPPANPDEHVNPAEEQPDSTAAKETLHAHCHCRTIQFWISRPNAQSKHATVSPYPDLLIPDSLGQRANPANEPWWIQHSTHYLAGTCACTSCRHASGFDITFWAFVPTCNIFLDAACTTPFPFPSLSDRAAIPGLQTYQSSEGVLRTFCGTCGASVFFIGDEERVGRRGLVDVAVGLLDASEGARAEERLAWWTGRVSFTEEAGSKMLVGGLERGLREWERKRREDGGYGIARWEGKKD